MTVATAVVVVVRADPIPMIARLRRAREMGIGPAHRGASDPKGWWPMAYRKLTEAERAEPTVIDSSRPPVRF